MYLRIKDIKIFYYICQLKLILKIKELEYENT